jgi:hypothetical protein
MSAVARRLARRATASNLGDIFARRVVTSFAPASTSAPSSASTSIRFVASSASGAKGRAYKGATRVSATPTREPDPRTSTSSTGASSSSSNPDPDPTTESLTARGELFASPLNFRTWYRVLSNRPLEETWGRTIRERWRRTYATRTPDGTRSTRVGLQMLATNKFRVVRVFVKIGGVPFVAFAAFGAYAAWKACVLITGLGIIGFVVVGKAVGAGEAAVSALASLASAFEYCTGFAAQDGLVSSLALLVTLRTQYYTLPVILFAYEEVYHVARRLMRLSRWAR